MADPPDSPQQRVFEMEVVEAEDGQGGEFEAQRGETGPSHHPTAPADELFDVATTVDPSYVISLIRKLLPPVRGSCTNPTQSIDGMDTGDNNNVHSSITPAEFDNNLCLRTESTEATAREEVWEENGTILWDLAANQSNAELMVENLLLDVLLANLLISSSVRITEICLGIIGNLACHEVIMKQITSRKELLEKIVDQLFLDDTLCLGEVFRLLTLGVHSSEHAIWAKALHSEPILSRILWIVENTLNPLLIEKSVGLLLAILEDVQNIGSVLLPTLVSLGLASLLVNLLAFEMGKVTSERVPERYPALDAVLHAIEALSVNDDYSAEVCSRKEIFQIAVELVKLPEKIEIGNCSVTAAVLLANILTDSSDLATELSTDLDFSQGLFDLFPFTSDDPEARNALWSIAATLLIRFPETKMSLSNLSLYIIVLVSNTDAIKDDLFDYQLNNGSLPPDDNGIISDVKLKLRNIALKRIASILNQWLVMKRQNDRVASVEKYVDDGDVRKLLDCCLKHTS